MARARRATAAGVPRTGRTPSGGRTLSGGRIPIVVYEPSNDEAGVGSQVHRVVPVPDPLLSSAPGFFERIRRRVEHVPAETLKAKLQDFLKTMGETLNNIPAAVANYELNEIEIEVEVSAEGEVGLLGTGGKLGGKGSLTLKLKQSRSRAADENKPSS